MTNQPTESPVAANHCHACYIDNPEDAYAYGHIGAMPDCPNCGGTGMEPDELQKAVVMIKRQGDDDEWPAVPFIDAKRIVATALQAERERVLEEAAVACETLGFMIPIDDLIGMTKKEMSILTCKEAAKACRALAQKGGG